MKYDPIKLKRDGDWVVFYFVRDGREDWFYEFDIKSRDEMKSWDEHLSKKMWYTPEVRKQTLEMMEKILTTKR